MKFALVADDGQARVVAFEFHSDMMASDLARAFSTDVPSSLSTCKWHVCRREPSANGENLVTIETWEKGVKL